MGNIDLILYVLALVLFILAGLNVPRYNWQWLALPVW